jgi:hypothetical protein
MFVRSASNPLADPQTVWTPSSFRNSDYRVPRPKFVT